MQKKFCLNEVYAWSCPHFLYPPDSFPACGCLAPCPGPLQILPLSTEPSCVTALLINLSIFGNTTFVAGSKKVKAVLPDTLPHQAVGLRICFCQLFEHATNPSEPSH